MSKLSEKLEMEGKGEESDIGSYHISFGEL